MRRIEIHRRGALIIRIGALLLALTAISCSTSSSVTPVGAERYPPTSPAKDIIVFSNEADVKGPFKVVGFISLNNPGKYQVLTLGDVMPVLKQKAREVGANGLILDQVIPVKSGLISTGINVGARAIIVNQ